jgi:hypothetical protein
MNIALFIGMAERLPREVNDAETALRAHENVLRDMKLVAEAVESLRGSWADSDGRLYRPHWFFVKRYALNREDPGRPKISAYEKFWPSEVVSDLAAAKRARPLQVGAFSDAASAPCDCCGKAAPVVGRMLHDGDCATEDSWRLDFYALCGSCTALSVVATDFKTDAHY